MEVRLQLSTGQTIDLSGCDAVLCSGSAVHKFYSRPMAANLTHHSVVAVAHGPTPEPRVVFMDHESAVQCRPYAEFVNIMGLHTPIAPSDDRDQSWFEAELPTQR